MFSLRYLEMIDIFLPINQRCDPRIEIRAKSEQGRTIFLSMKIFTRSDLSLKLRMQNIRCYVICLCVLYLLMCYVLWIKAAESERLTTTINMN